ncbi:DUF4198 domain-containing protein [Thioalkalivibrio sp.]|uniref:DUF4198 domain-containing protein n=1 Tax=Thioalkalivibrio sp. TaxID=2093813 RepID=UPI0035696579
MPCLTHLLIRTDATGDWHGGTAPAGQRCLSHGLRWRARLPRPVPVLVTLLALGLLGMAAPAWAHYPWITASGDADGVATFRLGIGHAFPEDGPLAVDRVEEIRLVAVDGTVETLVLEDGETHALPDGADGARLIVAEQTPRFWSRTHEGGRPASRQTYPDALGCTQSVNVMKAVVGRGSSEAWRHRQGHALELVPVRDPAALKAGDPLAIEVSWHGEPWQGEVKATYAGYDGRSEDGYALTLQTDDDGVVRFVPAASGYWLVRAHAAEDYPDPSVCDRRSYFSTLTFVIR